MSEHPIKLDLQRQVRLGFDEAILCSHKTLDQLVAILEQAEQQHFTLLLTRLNAARFSRLPGHHRALMNYETISRTAFYGAVPIPSPPSPRVAVVTAGTSDAAVSREAVRTLAYNGVACLEVNDVGVAGLWRLLERVEEIRQLPVVIVVAGMEAALPSVLAGLVPGLVIAVPTSVGYGIAEGGETALRAMLASCTPGLLVVNIDNGYGAACAALRMLNAWRNYSGRLPES